MYATVKSLLKSSFNHLEQSVGDVEDTCLKEEDERDPLVVGLVGDLVSLLVVFPPPGMNQVPAPLPGKVSGQGEGTHDEAVGVHDVLGNGPVVGVAILDTRDVDPIPDVLDTRDQDAAD